MSMAVLHRENAFCVGLLGAIHKKMNYILNTFPCCARPLSSHRKWGDDLAKMPIFIEFGLPCYVKNCARPLSSHHLDENDNFEKSN